MNITDEIIGISPEMLASIRAVAVSARDGADGAEWDREITPDVVISLCNELHLLRLRNQILISRVQTDRKQKIFLVERITSLLEIARSSRRRNND